MAAVLGCRLTVRRLRGGANSQPPTRAFADMGVLVVDVAEHALRSLHASTGLPWWAVIAGTTATLRLGVTLPLVLHQQHVLARLENLRPQLLEWQTALQHKLTVEGRRANQSADQVNAKYKSEYATVRKALLAEHNCAPWRAALPIYLHVPVWIILSFGP